MQEELSTGESAGLQWEEQLFLHAGRMEMDQSYLH